MRANFTTCICLAGLLATSGEALSAEAGFSVYGLGGSSFNAGITPPAGTYVTGLAGYYTGVINGTVTIGGVDIDAGAEVGFFQTGINVLYVPETKVLGGNLGLSITVPIGHIDLTAMLAAGGPGITQNVNGWGQGDITPRAQVGWAGDNFFNTLYVQGTLPTGKYEPGFFPSIGLNRPAVDAGWAFTMIEPDSKVQFNGIAGLTYNFENPDTDYTSGAEFHFEWALAKDFGNGLIVGLVGYDYRQITGDSGPGSTLGDFKGSVDAVGLGLSYSTKIEDVPVSVSLRHYREFNTVHRWEGDSTLATVSFVF